ncbi:MAG TPA: BTAD domain-containing putative transcriptional regulator [Actinophytocola sp.]|uniref:AfsR/SARP family transcriptional regulator n=1 Tax=Actinophytocola sp. TaxID=1872138 RepID=UPI002DB9FBFA|nr:BTAD domain-containing putative transcriptional regulator [Actinophytocola sp.]HEU5469470.1 BTAD domain-containing putative transcriptional regulator [Actinophytocola sp.]
MFLRFRVLGTLLVVGADGEPAPMRSARQRSLLAMLLFHANEYVPTERLVDAVWPDDPPKSYAANLHTYVSRLRERIGAPSIDANGNGYRLAVADDELDLLVFRGESTLGRRAGRAGDWPAAVRHLRRALAQWHDREIIDPRIPALEPEIARLEAERRTVFEDCMAAELTAGRHVELVGELRAAVVEHPLSERLAGQLMVALRVAGRPAEALEVYRVTRTNLVAETGIEPGSELRELHAKLLGGEPVDRPPPPADRPVSQLPADIADFCGRQEEIGALIATVRTVPLTVLSGKPGVGKSTLAVRVAHRLRRDFPDGQLFAHLAGAGDPRDPAEVLAEWLAALGVPAAEIPVDLHARAATFRSRLADRRMLVLLDDAADPAQVRPLLPGTPSCAALVTSRRRLSGLAGARNVGVQPLTDAEAGQLLRRIAGERTSAEPVDAARIAAACGNLPLALRIAGTRLALRPHLRLGALADRLEDERQRLDELTVSDLAVRSSLALSYRALTPAAQTTLQLIGIVDVPNLPELAIAVLRGGYDADGAIEELIESSLLEPAGVDRVGEPRYQLHDVVLAFARELALAEEGRAEREQASTRLIDAVYALTDLAANRLPRAMPVPDVSGVAPAPGLASVIVRRVLADPEEWFATERRSLIAGLLVLCRIGRYRKAMRVFERFGRFLWLHGHYTDLETCAARLADAARAASDPAVAARADTVLALLDQVHGRYRRAIPAYRGATDRLTGEPDRPARGWAMVNLANCLLGLGDPEQALALATEAEGMFQLDGQAVLAAMRTRSAALHRLGRSAESVRIDTEALAMARRGGEPFVVALSLHSLSWTRAITGDLAEATGLAEQSVALLRTTPARSLLARALRALGAIHAGSDRRSAAIEAFAEALMIARELGEQPRVLSCTRALAAGLIGAGRPDLAADELTGCLRAYRELGGPPALAITLRLLAAAHVAAGDPVSAAEVRAEADELTDPRDASAATLVRMLLRLTEPGRARRPGPPPGTVLGMTSA